MRKQSPVKLASDSNRRIAPLYRARERVGVRAFAKQNIREYRKTVRAKHSAHPVRAKDDAQFVLSKDDAKLVRAKVTAKLVRAKVGMHPVHAKGSTQPVRPERSEGSDPLSIEPFAAGSGRTGIGEHSPPRRLAFAIADHPDRAKDDAKLVLSKDTA